MDDRPEPFCRRRVAVVGLQRSNAAVVRYLLARRARVEVYDQKPLEALAPYAGALPAGTPLYAGPDYLERLDGRLDGLAAIFVTPGMRKDLPALVRARGLGVPLWTEAAYVLAVAPRPVIGITGSAGKTTTTTIVGEVVRRWRPGSLVGGNIGLPLLDRLVGLPADAWIVMELSSFQLELARCPPTVAALLNLRPNHLDVHGSLEAYVDAKRRVYRGQSPDDWCVLGIDDPVVARLAGEVPAGRLAFSGLRPVAAGVGVEGEALVWRPPGSGGSGPARPWTGAGPVLPLNTVRLPGAHNRQNVAAAAAVCLAAGAPPTHVAAVVAGFAGVPHRLERVRDWRGSRFINDSIATTPDRVLAALDSLAGERVVLLAGGYNKGLSFDEFGAVVARRVERVLLFGAAAPAIARSIAAASAPDWPTPVEIVPDLATAVGMAAADAQPGQVVLLSPACASYDQFRDFEERGERFRALVAALPESGR